MKKMRTPVVLLASLLFFSCSALPQYKGIDEKISKGNYGEALKQIEENKKKYGSNNEILFLLDAGLLAHYTGDWTLSNEYLEKASVLMDENYRQSFGKTLGSFILNDNVKKYLGEDYEQLYLFFIKALNYLALGDSNGAMVEARRINEFLTYLQTKYKKAEQDLYGSKELSSLDLSEIIPKGSSQFFNSAAGRYISLLLYRYYLNSPDDVRIDRDKIVEAFRTQSNLYPFPIPNDILDYQSTQDIQGKVKLNIISLTGKSPVKRAVNQRLFFAGIYLKLSFPALKEQPSAVSRIVVEAGSSLSELMPIEDINLTAQETFKAELPSIYLKTVFRAVTKAAATTALAYQAEKKQEGAGALTLLLGGLFNEITEQADLRTARFFPGMIKIGLLELDPDVKEITIRYYNKQNNLIFTEKRPLSLNTRGLNLIELVNLK